MSAQSHERRFVNPATKLFVNLCADQIEISQDLT
jgi:hypothetical protein